MRISSLLAFAVSVAALGSGPVAQAQQQTMHHPQPQPSNRPPLKPQPQPAQWRLLAFKTVGAGTDRDTINVARKERYRSIQLCAYNAPIHLMDFSVRFDSGQRQDVRVRSRIAAGSCTRAVQLAGNAARRVTRIDLTYQRMQRGMKVPVIRVMAR
ncbi:MULTISPECIES: hypothetical protein [unclassified Novosphingobium]|uniref:hypothetical protein n=1 Tax=unclassified Novosphingobium TaxID=2644732 RepID=UPI0013597995|nr:MULTISPECIES: hypothetical protein [unclassified Novosphingobium]